MRKFDFLVALYVFGIMVANLMGGKTVHIIDIGSFPLSASVALFAIPMLFIICDIVTEVYGKERARSIVWSGLIITLFLAAYAAFAVSLPPSTRFSGMEKAYDSVFNVAIRISLSSVTAFACSQLLDITLFSRLRKRMGNGGLWIRANTSNIISHLVDTTVFITLAFYAFDKSAADNIAFMAGLIIPYWLLKCFVSALGTPFVYWGVRWLRSPVTD